MTRSAEDFFRDHIRGLWHLWRSAQIFPAMTSFL